ncbi:uncharacterized protein [Ambystoma mexicanum]|uniref:uncharacterized protein isoform X2 n=1 Tax=Ambystoma mexicanum TaxID=8296 RepID=UPI0037E77305
MPRGNQVFPLVPSDAHVGAGTRRPGLQHNFEGGPKGSASLSARPLCTTQDYAGLVYSKRRAPPQQAPSAAPPRCYSSTAPSERCATAGLHRMQHDPRAVAETASFPSITRLPASAHIPEEWGRPGPRWSHSFAEAATRSSSTLPYPGDLVESSHAKRSERRSQALRQEGCHQCCSYPKYERQQHPPKSQMFKPGEPFYPVSQHIPVSGPEDTFGKPGVLIERPLEPANYLPTTTNEIQEKPPKSRPHILRALLHGCMGGHRFPARSTTCHHCYVVSSICWLTVIITIIIIIVTKVALG